MSAKIVSTKGGSFDFLEETGILVRPINWADAYGSRWGIFRFILPGYWWARFRNRNVQFSQLTDADGDIICQATFGKSAPFQISRADGDWWDFSIDGTAYPELDSDKK